MTGPADGRGGCGGKSLLNSLSVLLNICDLRIKRYVTKYR